MRLTALLLAAAAVLAPASAIAQGSGVELWRLDCGSLDVDLGMFSDTGMYQGQKRTLVASCYLVRDGDRYLLWESGVDGGLAGKPKDKEGVLLKASIVAQLARIGVKPEAVTYAGISHYHDDHTGQVRDFPRSTLLIGKGDWEVVQKYPPAKPRFAPWLTGGSKVDAVEGDKDVFGDGKVIMLDLPGHTEGHHGLLVRLASGPVLITGDQYHFTQNRRVGGVPSFNVDRADTLASSDRFEKLATNVRARVIIQHEPDDVAKLPVFPRSAK